MVTDRVALSCGCGNPRRQPVCSFTSVVHSGLPVCVGSVMGLCHTWCVRVEACCLSASQRVPPAVELVPFWACSNSCVELLVCRRLTCCVLFHVMPSGCEVHVVCVLKLLHNKSTVTVVVLALTTGQLAKGQCVEGGV